jgi:phospholipase/carboxylesterase
MSLSLLLTQPALLHAAIVLAQPPATGAAAAGAACATTGRKAWLSHGTQDNVIPLTSAHLTRCPAGACRCS